MTLPLNRLDEFNSFEDTARFNMIEQQIRPWLVDDPQVLELLATLKRENFILPAFRSLAFADIEIPLLGEQDAEIYPDRCMLPPKIEARFLNDLKIQSHEKILEIGTGSGYMAALLAALGQEVLSLEIHGKLVDFAKKNLEHNQIHNVKVLQKDASRDLPDGQFDVIVISGAVTQVPAALLERLQDGGRLIAVVGESPVMRVTMVRKENGVLHATTPWDYCSALLQGFPRHSEFQF
ncbi:protein-L-isoaspartate(D-aspartate) O-methyltransferase [Lampropedia hyalina DSM 16112]|jgi:protein-L-isoaspartate(D-aspartate) O-methyltransferase|uniref:Protein-L-isoaspartate O-methyltransferase n=1 Tax=Lampropedia hyalina DSM 16112 TaxID=1122156 RepID=A0A1M5D677_9BURK|nr:protein-L-isoaspartate O-methyltransferase [Lampropedia hyalina]SHF62192.1 protein-L-isoaspartate(D-aspartate) O-methyltransferase [Lampropedia hyalina DSM 16112]